MFPILLCTALLAPLNVNKYDLRLATCTRVATTAQSEGLDPALMVSIGWVESAMLPKVNSGKGAVGPLQVIPKYFCPKGKLKGCDTVRAGMDAFKAWRKHFPKLEDTLCHYNGGWKCKAPSKWYARKVLRIRARLSVAMR